MDADDASDDGRATELFDDGLSGFHERERSDIHYDCKPYVANVETTLWSALRYESLMIANWVREALDFKSMSGAELARQLTEKLGRSIDRAAVNKMLLNRSDSKSKPRALSADEMLAISEITGYPLPGAETGPPQEPVRVPVGYEFDPDPDFDEPKTFGTQTGRQGGPVAGIAEVDVTVGLGAGGLTTVSEATAMSGMRFAAEVVRDFWVFPAWMLSSLNIRPEHAAAFRAQGDSMEPSILNGEVVFVDTRHRVPSPPGIYALADQFGGVVMKRIEVISSPRDLDVRLRVISDNPRHETKEVDLADVQIVGRYLGKFTTELGH